MTDKTSEAVIGAVRRLSAQWETSDHSIKEAVQVGNGTLYTVVFRGQDRQWRENYVYDSRGKISAYKDLRDLLLDRANNLIPSLKSPEVITLFVVSFFALMLLIAVIYMATQQPDNKNLPLLTGLLGSTIGYLVGKVPTSGGSR